MPQVYKYPNETRESTENNLKMFREMYPNGVEVPVFIVNEKQGSIERQRWRRDLYQIMMRKKRGECTDFFCRFGSIRCDNCLAREAMED